MEIISLLSIIALSAIGTIIISTVCNPYYAIVKKLIRDNFTYVNTHQYDHVINGVSRTTFEHVFAGDNCLGGTRHDAESFRRWLVRVGTVLPDLQIKVQDIQVQGLPHHTQVVARWVATCQLLNGESYVNRGVHLITLKWGKVVQIHVYEDTQTVTHGLQVQFEAGIAEARAPKIES